MPSPMRWVQVLETKIEEQRNYAKGFEARYRNKYALPFIAREYAEVYGQSAYDLLGATLEAPKTGAAAIGVDALCERLTVLGGTSDDKATAKALEEAWEENDLDVMHRHAHLEALIRRQSFAVVSPSAVGGKGVLTIESSEQAAVHRMGGPPYDVDAYLKTWNDEWTTKRAGMLKVQEGADHRVYQLVEREDGQLEDTDPLAALADGRWKIAKDDLVKGPVPVVEFPHMPRLLEDPMSEIEPVTTLVDLVDLIEGLMVFAGHFGAVPIRYGTSLDIPRDPNDVSKPLLGPDGKPLIGFKPRADHFWFNSNKDAKFGQLEPASLETFVAWANHARANLRTKTKIPSTYYGLDLKSHMTGELLKVDEAPMVRRIAGIGRRGTFNQAWRKAQTYLVRLEGHHGRVRPLWEDPQTRVEAAAVDAFQKAVASRIGVVTAAEQFLGWTREMAEKAVQEAADDQARLGLDPTLARLADKVFGDPAALGE